MKIDGQCHCGNITYRTEIDPEQVYICHCTDCQSISGTAFRWAVSVAEEDFQLLTGSPKTYIKRAESGAESHQLFCPDCASPLYLTAIGEGPKSFNLKAYGSGSSHNISNFRMLERCAILDALRCHQYVTTRTRFAL